MAAYTTVTVLTGKKITVQVGPNLITYEADATVSIPTHEAVKLKAAGLVTY